MCTCKLIGRLMLMVGLALAPALLAPPRSQAASPLATARVRILHAIPDAPAVEIFVDSTLLIPHLAYGHETAYGTLTPTAHHLQVFPAGASYTAHGGLVDATVSFRPSKYYTIAAVGMMKAARAVVFRSGGPEAQIANRAVVRFVHLSPDAPPVDISVMGKPHSTIFAGTAFNTVTKYATFAPGTYTLLVHPAGSLRTILAVPHVTLQADHLYTLYVLGLVKGGKGGAMLTVLVSDTTPVMLRGTM